MSKINWVFQNENGTNLNRYIATNVATGEQVTFDLLRGANISIIGTPLNADNLNSLITAINSNYDEIVAIKERVSTIEKDYLKKDGGHITWLYVDEELDVVGDAYFKQGIGFNDGDVWLDGNSDNTRLKVNNKEVAFVKELEEGTLQVGAIQNQCVLGDTGLYLDDVLNLKNGKVYNAVSAEDCETSQLSLNLRTYMIEVNDKSVQIYNAGLYSVELTSTVNAGYGNTVVLVSVEDMNKTYHYPFHYDVSSKGTTTAKAEELIYSSSDKTISLFWDTSTSWTIKRIRLITEYTYGV